MNALLVGRVSLSDTKLPLSLASTSHIEKKPNSEETINYLNHIHIHTFEYFLKTKQISVHLVTRFSRYALTWSDEVKRVRPDECHKYAEHAITPTLDMGSMFHSIHRSGIVFGCLLLPLQVSTC